MTMDTDTSKRIQGNGVKMSIIEDRAARMKWGHASSGCAGWGNSYRRTVENDDLTDATARNGGWTLDITLLWFNQNQRVKLRKSGLSVLEAWVKLVMGSCWWVEFEQLPRRICGRCRELEPLWVLEALEEGKSSGVAVDLSWFGPERSESSVLDHHFPMHVVSMLYDFFMFRHSQYPTLVICDVQKKIILTVR